MYSPHTHAGLFGAKSWPGVSVASNSSDQDRTPFASWQLLMFGAASVRAGNPAPRFFRGAGGGFSPFRHFHGRPPCSGSWSTRALWRISLEGAAELLWLSGSLAPRALNEASTEAACGLQRNHRRTCPGSVLCHAARQGASLGLHVPICMRAHSGPVAPSSSAFALRRAYSAAPFA